MFRLAILLFLIPVPAFSSPLRAVATLAPLHAVVSAVADGVFTPELLLDPSVSVHDYAPKPSDVAKIDSADAVFWGGKTLEGGLVKTVLSANGRVFTALKDGEDPHFWLSPDRIGQTAREIAAFLSAADPDNARTYGKNADAFIEKTADLKAFGRRELEPYADTPFVVFHDAYDGFERDFGLRGKKGEVQADGHHAAGAGHLIRLRAAMREAGTVCLFSEPQMPSDRLSVLTEDLSVVSGTADPLGTGVPAGKNFYDGMMKNLIRSFKDCLSKVKR